MGIKDYLFIIRAAEKGYTLAFSASLAAQANDATQGCKGPLGVFLGSSHLYPRTTSAEANV